MKSDKSDLGAIHQLTDNEQDFLKHKRKQLLYLKGENLFKQGAFASHVIYIQTGLVKVYLQTQPNKQMNVSIAKPGDFLAFGSVFGDDTYSYSAIAIKDSEVCMIDKDGLRELLFRNNDFAMRITESNFKLERHHMDIIASLSYKQMRGKLATALIYLSSEDLMEENVFQYLNRQEIAGFAAISNESGIKFLKEFEKEGILKLKNRDIEILDTKRLNTISKMG